MQLSALNDKYSEIYQQIGEYLRDPQVYPVFDIQDSRWLDLALRQHLLALTDIVITNRMP